MATGPGSRARGERAAIGEGEPDAGDQLDVERAPRARRTAVSRAMTASAVALLVFLVVGGGYALYSARAGRPSRAARPTPSTSASAPANAPELKAAPAVNPASTVESPAAPTEAAPPTTP